MRIGWLIVGSSGSSIPAPHNSDGVCGNQDLGCVFMVADGCPRAYSLGNGSLLISEDAPMPKPSTGPQMLPDASPQPNGTLSDSVLAKEPDPERTVDDPVPLIPQSSDGAPQDSEMGLAGYRVLGRIGKGGMGSVMRVHDPDLKRDLAVKVLREDYLGRSDLEHRFLGEAQITAQLQHPGIVPIHEVGRLPDGRPYLAMKLVQGRTLAELLAERPSPQHDLSRFVAIFEQICQAVAFAHSKHVIHRDLKPLNVMVGRFGEVQVMDWGLAKVLTDRTPKPEEPKAASVVHTLR